MSTSKKGQTINKEARTRVALFMATTVHFTTRLLNAPMNACMSLSVDGVSNMIFYCTVCLFVRVQSSRVAKVPVSVCVCVCVFIKLHMTAQSGLVILVILCHSR